MSAAKKGRKPKVDPVKVAAWRQARKASIAETAKHFGISATAVKNHCRDHGDEARQARERWRIEQEVREADELEYAVGLFEARMQRLRKAEQAAEHDKSWGAFFDLMDAANSLVPREYRNKKPGEW